MGGVSAEEGQRGFAPFRDCGPGPGNQEGRRGSWFFSLLFFRPSWPGSAHRVPIPVSQCERQWAEQSCGLYSWKSGVVVFFSFSQCDLTRAWSQGLEWKGDISTQALFWDSGQFLSGSHLAFSVTFSSGTLLILYCSSQSVTVTSPCFSEIFFFFRAFWFSSKSFQGQRAVLSMVEGSESLLLMSQLDLGILKGNRGSLDIWIVPYVILWMKKEPMILQNPAVFFFFFKFLVTVPSQLLPHP